LDGQNAYPENILSSWLRLKTIHNWLILTLELRVDFRQQSIIGLDVLELPVNLLQTKVRTLLATPTLPIALGCVREAIPIQGAINVLKSFLVDRLS